MEPQPLAASPQGTPSLAQNIPFPLSCGQRHQQTHSWEQNRQQSAIDLNASIKSFILQQRHQNLAEKRQKLEP